jgi:DinB superfamily
MAETSEPWLRGTLMEVDPVRRGVLHALLLAREDVVRWASGLTLEELEDRPFGLPSVGFQMRHMVRSLDRLLTYAEGRYLSDGQRTSLAAEMEPAASREALFAEFEGWIQFAEDRVMTFSQESFGEVRGVGRKRLPTTVGGLLVHCAEHTQRHAGQLVTTAKVVVAMRRREE